MEILEYEEEEEDDEKMYDYCRHCSPSSAAILIGHLMDLLLILS